MSAAAAASAADFGPDLVKRHDDAIEYYLKNQVTDPKSKWSGGLPDAYGLHAPGSAVGMWDVFMAGFVNPQSRFHKDNTMVARTKLAAEFVDRSTSPEGNIYLPITNFNSPPDSAFACRSACNAVFIGRKYEAKEMLALIEPRAKRLADAITTGGIHTPNHRWVVCAGLSQAHELWPEPRYLQRIEQWLAEGVDIDSDGQWSERSTAGYNAICCNAYTVIAHKLKRPELLDPVRRNLESMLYLLHADGEVETGFSRRQDLNTRGTMSGYWFPLQYFAVKLGDRRFAKLASDLSRTSASLPILMEYPELNKFDYPTEPLPDNFLKDFPHNHILRIRRGPASVTVSTEDRDRFLSLRYGDAVIQAIRFASAFFGKGQFVPQHGEVKGAEATMLQELSAPYYQPFSPTRKINADEWDATQKLRPKTQICNLTQRAHFREIDGGVALTVEADGTDNVPIAVEINVREGSTKLEGVEGNLVTASEARLVFPKNSIRITGGGTEHKYVEIRGALPKLPGQSIYVTGFTPFRRTLEFRWS